jgi:hypothetical protein
VQYLWYQPNASCHVLNQNNLDMYLFRINFSFINKSSYVQILYGTDPMIRLTTIFGAYVNSSTLAVSFLILTPLSGTYYSFVA